MKRFFGIMMIINIILIYFTGCSGRPGQMAKMKSYDTSIKYQIKADSSSAQEPIQKKEKVETKNIKNGENKKKSRGNGKKPQALYLSADDSNSQASPVIVRKMIRQGKYVQPNVIRTYEFLNYYTFGYKADKNDIRIIPQLLKKNDKGKYSLQVAIRSKNKKFENLPSMNITLLLDISGSMAGEPITTAKKLIYRFVKKLRKNDKISLIVCNRDAETLMNFHNVSEDSATHVMNILDDIYINDVTNLEKGISLAYKVAEKNYKANYLNRVILISDGATNAGKMALGQISKYAGDSDKQGIYLAGIGLGQGFNDMLMDTFTDKGRGAYIFLDSEKEINRILDDTRFVSNFDLSIKDVRLKINMPAGWKMKEFHGEQVSTKAAEVIPQYLAPNDQMIYHLTVKCENSDEKAMKQEFVFEAEYTPIGDKPNKLSVTGKVSQMLLDNNEIKKGDAIVEYAEMLKKIKYPLDKNKESNLKKFNHAFKFIKKINESLNDKELSSILALLKKYKTTLEFGEFFPDSTDNTNKSIVSALGLSDNNVKSVSIEGVNPKKAVKTLERLGQSIHLVPQEGYRFLALSSGPIWNPHPSGSGSLSKQKQKDPSPVFIGYKRIRPQSRPIHDVHKVILKLKAPVNAKSFSFDFNFFSAEYPNYIKKNFNDTFYAVIRAKSTNDGASTNISFDANNDSIEVDNNYFENEFHPIPNRGTGFDNHGSTAWLRTSWPIKGGEEFTLIFSIHDEGDSIYDSLVVIDNFRWSGYQSVGTTDPLN